MVLLNDINNVVSSELLLYSPIVHL